MLLNIIRAVFVLIVAGLGVRMAKATANPTYWAIIFAAILLTGVIVVTFDLLIPRKRIQTISAVYFGLLIGLILSYFLQIAVEPVSELFFNKLPSAYAEVPDVVTTLLTVVICYICVSLLLQTKDDFRFIIPYMEFSREVKGSRPLILDTSVIIDGRIADVADSRVLDQPLLVPRFVLQELQTIADSSDKLRRNRGRRGLDVLNRLQKAGTIEVKIYDAEPPELRGIREVDQKLVLLARNLGGKIVTNDYNLNKIAKLQGVDVINLNDLANALKPIVLPGETLQVKLIKRGEEPGQGVGYLDDGTMVVAEQGMAHMGETIRLLVTSVLQTSAGRMIFGRLDQVVSGGGGSPGRTPFPHETPGKHHA
jgi:uncharacterized protein YacL